MSSVLDVLGRTLRAWSLTILALGLATLDWRMMGHGVLVMLGGIALAIASETLNERRENPAPPAKCDRYCCTGRWPTSPSTGPARRAE